MAISKNVSRETFLKLESYVALLQKWTKAINLVGKSTEQEIWERHIADSLQLLKLIPDTIQTAADLGSGGGLPGLVIAIARPELAISLVEQDQRKAAFLQEAVAQLGLKNARVLAADIRSINEKFQLVTARALAPLNALCALAYPLCERDAVCLFPKGRNFAMELEEAKREWRFTHQTTPSQTQGEAAILSITHLLPGQATL